MTDWQEHLIIGPIVLPMVIAAAMLLFDERRRLLTEKTDALLVEADHLGYSLNETVNLVRERHAALMNEREDDHADKS